VDLTAWAEPAVSPVWAVMAIAESHVWEADTPRAAEESARVGWVDTEYKQQMATLWTLNFQTSEEEPVRTA
jgi:hypothetical protein